MNAVYYRYYFLVFMSWSCTYTMITVYMNEGLGIPMTTVGIFMSFVPLITMVFQPLWGALSDKCGDRKSVLFILMPITLILTLIFPMIENMWIGFICYALFMMFLAGQNPLSDGMTINYINFESGSTSYGIIRSWGSIGYAVGAFVVAGIAGYFGIKSIFYYAAISYILSILQLRKLKSYGIKNETRSYWHDLSELLRNRAYVYLLIFAFLLIGSFFAGEQYIFMYTRRAGIAMSEMGMITSLSVIVEIPFIFYSRRLIEYFGLKKMLWMITLADIIRMFILSISTQFAFFVVAGVFRGIFVGSFIPFFIELISRMTKSQLVTSGIAIYSAVSTGFGAFVFTVLGSAVASNLTYQSMYVFYALIALVNVLMLSQIRILSLQKDQ